VGRNRLGSVGRWRRHGKRPEIRNNAPELEAGSEKCGLKRVAENCRFGNSRPLRVFDGGATHPNRTPFESTAPIIATAGDFGLLTEYLRPASRVANDGIDARNKIGGLIGDFIERGIYVIDELIAASASRHLARLGRKFAEPLR
jgi:hypothetical protein